MGMAVKLTVSCAGLSSTVTARSGERLLSFPALSTKLTAYRYVLGGSVPAPLRPVPFGRVGVGCPSMAPNGLRPREKSKTLAGPAAVPPGTLSLIRCHARPPSLLRQMPAPQ